MIQFAIRRTSRQVEDMNRGPVVFGMLIQAVIAAILALLIDSPLFHAFGEGLQIAQIAHMSTGIHFHVLQIGEGDDALESDITVTPP